MLEQVLEIVREKAMEAVNCQVAIPVEKREESVKATTDSISDGLKEQVNMSNIGLITGLLSGTTGVATNPIVSHIKGNVVDSLMKKAGLSRRVSSQVADRVLPAVVDALSKRVNDSGKQGFDIPSFVKAFSGSHRGSFASSLQTIFW